MRRSNTKNGRDGVKNALRDAFHFRQRNEDRTTKDTKITTGHDELRALFACCVLFVVQTFSDGIEHGTKSWVVRLRGP